MNFDVAINMLCGAFLTLAVEGLVIVYWTFKGIKDGIFDETSESDTEKI